jgi:hypothetical protein
MNLFIKINIHKREFYDLLFIYDYTTILLNSIFNYINKYTTCANINVIILEKNKNLFITLI